MGFERFECLIESKIKDISVGKYLKEYLKSIYSETNISFYKDIINCFDDVALEDLSWELLCKQVAKISKGTTKLIEFYAFLIDNNVNLGQFSKYLSDNMWLFNVNSINSGAYKKIFFEGSNPHNIYFFRNGKTNLTIYLNVDNDELRKILIEFLNHRKEMGKHEKPLQAFVEIFEESLKNFYVFLMETLEKQNSDYQIFSKECGIDRNYIFRIDFYSLYEAGYKVIDLNKVDDLPIEDKWLLNPNGYEKNTTAIKPLEYMPLDFSRVKDENMKTEAKEWFFYSHKSLKALRNAINAIFIFFEFVEGEAIADIKGNVVDFYERRNVKSFHPLINRNNILIYREYLNKAYDSQYTINGYISALSSFVKYIYKKGKYDINSKVLDCFKIKSPKDLKSKIIIKEDLEKIVQKLKDNMSNGGIIDKLLWIFYHISITTNFRLNEILDLKRDCIIETMKIGEYAI